MRLDKAIKRDNERRKAKNGMVVTNRSIFVIQSVQIKKATKAKRKKKNGK